MALLLKQLANWYIYARDEANDPRTSSWPLVHSPVSVLFIVTVYFSTVKYWLPNYMKHRPTFNIRYLLIFYNFLQVILNAYIVMRLFKSYHTLDIRCAPLDTSTTNEYSHHSTNFAGAMWFFYMIKLLDLLDTAFFVLRKNPHQVTFLHVYHHVGTVVMGWIGAKYAPGGESMHLVLINCTVHVAMYSYYMLTVLKPEKREVLARSKKYVTRLQLLQFIVLLGIYAPKLVTACSYPKWIIWVLIPQLLTMVLMFGEFYYRVYIKNSKKFDNLTPNNNKTM